MRCQCIELSPGFSAITYIAGGLPTMANERSISLKCLCPILIQLTDFKMHGCSVNLNWHKLPRSQTPTSNFVKILFPHKDEHHN